YRLLHDPRHQLQRSHLDPQSPDLDIVRFVVLIDLLVLALDDDVRSMFLDGLADRPLTGDQGDHPIAYQAAQLAAGLAARRQFDGILLLPDKVVVIADFEDLEIVREHILVSAGNRVALLGLLNCKSDRTWHLAPPTGRWA